jgi:hypothetical protein
MQDLKKKISLKRLGNKYKLSLDQMDISADPDPQMKGKVVSDEALDDPANYKAFPEVRDFWANQRKSGQGAGLTLEQDELSEYQKKKKRALEAIKAGMK